MASNPTIFHNRALRWEELCGREAAVGEGRLNLIRLFAILPFYAYHLINFYWIDPGSIELAFHIQVSALVLAWSCEVVLLYYWGRRRWLMHPQVQYMAVGWDIIMISVLLMLCQRPAGALVMLYLLVIASSSMRLSLTCVYFATLACVAGYLFALGQYVFFDVGYLAYYATPELRLSRNEQIQVILTILATGFVAGQVVRQAKRLAQSFAARED
ncbi:MAG: hypothetical protein R3C53_09490 [Pirellulaceae bacterium]